MAALYSGIYIQIHTVRFQQRNTFSAGLFHSGWSMMKSHYVTFDLLGSFYLPLTFRISPFEVNVVSLHTGLRSDNSIIGTNLSSQPDV